MPPPMLCSHFLNLTWISSCTGPSWWLCPPWNTCEEASRTPYTPGFSLFLRLFLLFLWPPFHWMNAFCFPVVSAGGWASSGPLQERVVCPSREVGRGGGSASGSWSWEGEERKASHFKGHLKQARSLTQPEFIGVIRESRLSSGTVECHTRGRRDAAFVRFGFLLKDSENTLREMVSFGLVAISEAGLEGRIN